MYIPVILAITGFVLLMAGIIYRSYLMPKGYYEKSDNEKQNGVDRFLKKLEQFLAPSKDSGSYKYLENIGYKLDAGIEASRLWLYKLICLFSTFLILVMISNTNAQLLKQNIIGTWWKENSYAYTISPEEYKYNATLYKEVVSRIGEKNLKKLNNEDKKSAVSKAMYKGSINGKELNNKVEAFILAFQKSENLGAINLNLILACAFAFFLPEIILFIRKIIIGTKYRREAIMLENIFGLLGSIQDYKTIFIIKDMSLATRIFNKQLGYAATLFYTDKNKAFEYLKKSINERSFKRLVDTMRVYSTVDKKLALTILERNLKEQEEQLFLSAEEDVDVVDVLAFMSVVPILYEVANLMLNPMLDLVFKAFNFI